ncbi:MAG: hypothetical protein ABSF13_12855 [Smithella sp.]|jgi:5S rRNA maturation endonuclease (ribonuclease M5)
MSKCIGIIVDGDGDFASLRKRFIDRYRILKTDGPRGHAAKITDIANRARKQISILRAFQCNRVIIVLDFENRSGSYKNFVGQIRQAFNSVAFDVPVNIAVPNIMIENWYLADIEHISRKKSFIRNNLKQKNYEGKNGKSVIKNFMVHGVSYSETDHGPKMFSILRFDVAKKNSSSFGEFLEMVKDN